MIFMVIYEFMSNDYNKCDNYCKMEFVFMIPYHRSQTDSLSFVEGGARIHRMLQNLDCLCLVRYGGRFLPSPFTCGDITRKSR